MAEMWKIKGGNRRVNTSSAVPESTNKKLSANNAKTKQTQYVYFANKMLNPLTT